jgi:hypothetical protein
VFEQGRYSPRRRVDPPQAVYVDLGVLWPPRRVRWGQDTPLWVRSSGVQVNTAVPGLATECVLTSTGDWWVLCEYSVKVGNTTLALSALVPPSALQPRHADPDDH